MERALRVVAALKGIGGQAGRELLAGLSDETGLPFLPIPSGPEVWIVHGSEHVAVVACLLRCARSEWLVRSTPCP